MGHAVSLVGIPELAAGGVLLGGARRAHLDDRIGYAQDGSPAAPDGLPPAADEAEVRVAHVHGRLTPLRVVQRHGVRVAQELAIAGALGVTEQAGQPAQDDAVIDVGRVAHNHFPPAGRRFDRRHPRAKRTGRRMCTVDWGQPERFLLSESAGQA